MVNSNPIPNSSTPIRLRSASIEYIVNNSNSNPVVRVRLSLRASIAHISLSKIKNALNTNSSGECLVGGNCRALNIFTNSRTLQNNPLDGITREAFEYIRKDLTLTGDQSNNLINLSFFFKPKVVAFIIISNSGKLPHSTISISLNNSLR